MEIPQVQHQAGRKRGKIFLFALSTCIWCRKTKQLLQDLEIEFDFVDLDRLDGEEKETVLGELRKWNPDVSFPTLVINDAIKIIGFHETEVREALGE
jgi:glutaredoxin-like protein NrdH